ncbi:MAG TPA: glycosyltransferase family 4 protein, partial [Pirellulales bacterium]|nr:glycosyltransferase family 4 protein [Pirellulales bacterium]
MRIAHVITRLILGGAQENTLLTCEGLLRDYGDEVLLITGPPLGPEGSLLDRARANRVPLQMVPSLRRSIHPWRDWTSYRALKKILRDFRPDVVHTHSAKGGVLGRAAADSLRVPAIVHGVHGAPFYPYQNPLVREFYRRCERWAARRCHAFVSVADAMTDLLVESGVDRREKFTTIYSGMETEPFLRAHEHRAQVRRELGYSDEHLVVGKIARLFHLKGHDDVIAAAGRLVARHPMVRFLFVGDGILRESLEERIAREGLRPYFQFTGLAPPEQMPRLIGGMDVVVHTSLREGLARVLPQALIAGRPVVSYDIDGAREVVLPGQTGYLLPPRDVTALAAALDELLGDGGLRQRLGQEGRRRFADVFRHHRMTEQTRALYVRLLEGQTNAVARRRADRGIVKPQVLP